MIGPLLRQQRRIQDLNQDDLADEAGITAKHLSRIENGKSMPGKNVLHELLRILKCELLIQPIKDE